MRLFVWDRAARGQVWRMLGDALVAGGRVHSSAGGRVADVELLLT
jgi:hypothetical protein